MLSVQQWYRIVRTDDPERGPWKASTRAYAYVLEDNKKREYVAFHWHPDGRNGTTRPHMHLGDACGVDPHLGKIHLPTGRISVEDFLWVVIDGFDVPAKRGDWTDVLAESRSVFEEWRTWS